jgi:uncharacterized iron-regulated membrane protein
MNYYELIPNLIFAIAFFAFLIWGKRRIKKKAVESGKIEEFEKKKKKNAAFLYPLTGLALVGIVIFKWQSLPSGNEPIALFYLGLGIVSILFGLYKWFQFSKQK